ncbi:MAG: hypothetical protein QXD43_01170 [Candidatus Aenigmatarchaeota archaeon]
MKKRYLIAILLVGIIIFILFYTFSPQLLISNAVFEQQNQENKTEPFKFPFKLPWQATETTSNTTTGTIGSNATAGGIGGAGGNNPSNQTIQQNITNYTLSVSSVPDGLKIFASYYVNDIKTSIIMETPFELHPDVNSIVCVIPAYITGSGILKWLLDGQNCQNSICENSSYGCLINMNTDHSVTLYFMPVS